MADFWDVDWDKLDRTKSNQPGTLSDTWNVVSAGAKNQLIGGTAALGRVAAEKMGSANFADLFTLVGKMAHESAKDNIEDLSTAGRAAFEAGITSEEFWSHPLRATYLKSMGMLPSVAAAVIPGSLMAGTARALGAGVAARGTAASVGAATGAGAIASSESADELYQRVDAMKDADLRKQSVLYDTLRDDLPEREARVKYNAQLRQLSIPINFLLGGLAGAVGPGGMLARRATGAGAVLGASGGRLKAAGMGVAEGALTEAPQEAVSEYSTQSGLVKGQFQKDIDWGKVAASGLEGGYLGAVLGGLGGAVSHQGAPKSTPDAPPAVPPKSGNVTPTTPQGPAPDEAQALGMVGAVYTPENYGGVSSRGDAWAPPPGTQDATPKSNGPDLSFDPVSEGGYDSSMYGEPTGAALPRTDPMLGQQAPQEAVATSQAAADLTPGETPPAPAVDPLVGSAAQTPVQATTLEPTLPPTPEAARQPRVLEPVATPQSKAAARDERARQKRLFAANIDRAGLKLDADGKVVSDAPTGDEQVKEKNMVRAKARIARNEQADTVFKKFNPPAEETNDALKARVIAGREAAKAADIKFGNVQRTRSGVGDVTPGWVWVNEVNRLANRIRNKKATAADLKEFQAREKSLLAGDIDTVIAARQLEGELFGKAKGAKKAEENAKDAALDAKVAKQAATDRGVVGNVGDPDSAAAGWLAKPNPEEALIAKQETELTSEEAADILAKSDAMRAKRIALRRKESELLHSEPKLEAKAPPKVEVLKRHKVVKPTQKPLASRRSPGTPELVETAYGLELLEPTKKTRYSKDTTVSYLERMSGADVLQRVRKGLKKDASRSARIIDRAISTMRLMQAGRIRRLVKDTNVFVLSEAEFSRAYTNKDVEAAAVFDPATGNVFMRESVLDLSPEDIGHILQHELTHAATARGLWKSQMASEKNPRAFMGKLYADGVALTEEIQQKFDHYYGPEAARAYAFTNPYELIAEVNSNPKFIEMLSHIPVEASDMRNAGLEGIYTKKTAWDMVLAYIRRVLGLGSEQNNALELVLRYNEHVVARQELLTDTRKSMTLEEALPISMDAMNKGFDRAYDSALARAASMRDNVSEDVPRLLKLSMLNQIAQASDRFFKNNPVRKISDLVEQLRTRSMEIFDGDLKLHKELGKLEAKYQGTKEWESFVDTALDNTMFSLDPSKTLAEHTWLGKAGSLQGAQSRAKYPRVKRAYDALPEDLRAMLHTADAFYRKRQNTITYGALKNLLNTAGHTDPALLDRVFNNKLTAVDEATVGGTLLASIARNAAFRKLNGLYTPIIRRGMIVILGHNYLDPGAGRLLDVSTVEFDTEKEAAAFVAAQTDKASARAVYVDATTGKRERLDPYTKTMHVVLASDSNVRQVYQVAVQNQHVIRAANKREGELIKAGLIADGFSDVAVQTARDDTGSRGTGLSGVQIDRLTRDVNSEEFKHLSDSQKQQYKQALLDVGASLHSASHISASRLARKYVPGASRNLTRNLMEYSSSSSHYLAYQEKALAIDTAMSDLDTQTDHLIDQNNDAAFARSEIRNEVRRRVNNSREYVPPNGLTEWVSRVKTLSFLARLAGPSWSVINTLQPGMVTAPVLAGRYGVRATLTEMHRSYQLISGMRLLGQGLKDTVNTALRKKMPDGSTHFDEVLSRLDGQKDAAELKAMLKHLASVGSVDATNGFEISELVTATSPGDKALAFMDDLARQLPTAIEMMNRAVTAITTYRLERARGISNELASEVAIKYALQYAQDITNNTQGQYSKSNAAPIFHHPLWSLSLQFKKYPQMMYHLMGQLIGKAIRNQAPGDRAEAVKQLGFLVTTHMLAAGAAGLPIEPIKFILLGANQLGLTDDDWGDVEHWFRKQAAELFGSNKAAEIIMHGATRALPGGFAFDISSRVGLDNMLLFGEPRSKDPKDVKSFLWDTIVGAPGSTLADFGTGVHHMVAGEWVKAAEKMIPIKAVSDAVRSARQTAEGKMTKSGRPSLTPYTPQEAILRGLGFTPAREAETSRMRSQIAGSQAKYKADRSKLMQTWITSESKTDAMADIRKFNQKHTRDERISMTDLYKAQRQRKKEEKDQVYRTGLRATRRNATIVDQARYYNTE